MSGADDLRALLLPTDFASSGDEFGLDGWDPSADIELAGLLAVDSALRHEEDTVVADADPDDTGSAADDADRTQAPGFTADAAFVARAAQDLASLSPDGQVDLLVTIRRVRGWLSGVEHRTLTAFTTTPGGEQVMPVRRMEAAAVLRVAPQAVARRLEISKSLTRFLPATLAALDRGTLDEAQATAVAVGSWAVPAHGTARFEAIVLDNAAEMTLTELKRRVELATMTVDPAGAQARHDRALGERRVEKASCRDGMGRLTATVAAPDLAAIYDRLTAAARALPRDDPRTRDQQRADLLVDSLLAALDPDRLPTRHGHRPEIAVHVPLSSLLGVEDQPGWIDGFGPVTAQMARELAHTAGATLRRLLTDPVSGTVLDEQVRRYRPPKPVTELVLWRDGVCAAPGCNQPAFQADLDHVTPHRITGLTSSAGLKPLCRTHHRLKTLGDDWHRPIRYVVNGDGSTTWRFASRHRYVSRPPTRILTFLSRAGGRGGPAGVSATPGTGPHGSDSWHDRVRREMDRARVERWRIEDTDHARAIAAIRADLTHAEDVGDRATRRRATKALRVLAGLRRRQLAERQRLRTNRRRQQDVANLGPDAPPPF